MTGRKNEAGGAEDRIYASCENTDRLARAVDLEVDFSAFTASDPVALHRQDTVRPLAFEHPVDIFQQFVGVFGDADEPLIHLALFDGCGIVAPAAPIHDLLVGEHRLAFVTPVQQSGLAVCQSALVHFQEEPLVPAIVLGFAGGDFARPVVAEIHALMLALHFADVEVRPFAGMAFVVDGRVFGGQTKGVPTHGVQHIVSAHPLITGQRIAYRVVAQVPDVKSAAWIRKHFEQVILGLRRTFFRRVQVGLLRPDGLPLEFNFLVIIRTFGHFVLFLL